MASEMLFLSLSSPSSPRDPTSSIRQVSVSIDSASTCSMLEAAPGAGDTVVNGTLRALPSGISQPNSIK